MNNQNIKYISLAEAAKLTNYSQDYISLLCRRGKMKGEKLGRNWFTTKEWIDDYINKTNGSGERVVPVRVKKAIKAELTENKEPGSVSNTLTKKLMFVTVIFSVLISGLVFLQQGIVGKHIAPTAKQVTSNFQGLYLNEKANIGYQILSQKVVSLSNSLDVIENESTKFANNFWSDKRATAEFVISRNVNNALRYRSRVSLNLNQKVISLSNSLNLISDHGRDTVSGRVVYARNTVSSVIRDLDIIKNEAVKFPERKIFALSNSLNTIENKSTGFVDSKIISLSGSLDIISDYGDKKLENFWSDKRSDSGVCYLAWQTQITHSAIVACVSPFLSLDQKIISLSNSLDVIENESVKFSERKILAFSGSLDRFENDANNNIKNSLALAKNNLGDSFDIYSERAENNFRNFTEPLQNKLAKLSRSKNTIVVAVSMAGHSASADTECLGLFFKTKIAKLSCSKNILENAAAGLSPSATTRESVISLSNSLDIIETAIFKNTNRGRVAGVATENLSENPPDPFLQRGNFIDSLKSIWRGAANYLAGIFGSRETVIVKEVERVPVSPKETGTLTTRHPVYTDTGCPGCMDRIIQLEQKISDKEIIIVTETLRGEKGDTGSAGLAGPIGLMGPAGTAGEQGEQGEAGPRGSEGTGNVTIVQSSPGNTNTWSGSNVFSGHGIFESLGVSYDISAGRSLGVGGSTTLGSDANDTLTVNAVSSFNNPVTLSNAASFTTGTEQATFGGNIDATLGLDITGADLTVGGTNFVVDVATGNITTAGDIVATGDITSNDVNVLGNLTVSGAQTYSGAAAFTANSDSPALLVNQQGAGNIVSFRDDGVDSFTIASGGGQVIAVGNIDATGGLNVTGITILGDGGTTNYAQFSATGDLTFINPAGSAIEKADGALTINTTGQNLTVSTTTTGDIAMTSAGTLALSSAGATSISSGGGAALTLDSDSGILTLGAGTNEIANTDTDTALLINPNGTGDVQFHTTSFYMNSAGDLVLGGRITFENAEYVSNETDDYILFQGSGGTDDTDLTFNLDGVQPIIYSATDTSIGVDDDLQFIGAQMISTSAGDLTIDSFANIIIADTTVQYSSGSSTFDIYSNSGATTLTISNSDGTEVAHLDLADGSLYTGGTERLTVAGALASITGYSQTSGDFTIAGTGNILFSTSGTINQSGAGQVTFAGNLDATNGLDVTGADFTYTGAAGSWTIAATDSALTQTGTGANAFTGISSFSNATYSALFTGGNVGIGTATPTALLSINSSGSNPTINNPTSGQGVILSAEGGSTTGQLRIVSNDSAWADNVSTSYFQMRTLANNNATFMGGTYNADAPLDRLQFDSEYTTITNNSYTDTPVATAMFEVVNDTAARNIMQVIGANSQTGDYLQITSNGGSAGNILMVDSSGNVGIGTTSPLAALDVRGTIENGLVGWWSMDEGTGTEIADQSINSNTGTLGGDGAGDDLPTWTNGKFGKGLSFDGSDDYINCGHDSSLDVTDEITVEVWVKLDTIAAGNEYIVIRYAGATNYYSYFIRRNAAILSFAVNNASDSAAVQHFTTSAQIDTWYHLISVYDGSNIKTYLNGNYIGQNSQTGNVKDPGVDDLYIGQWGSADYFTGDIDEVRIYNRALSAREVAESYRQKAPSLAQGGTVSDNSAYTALTVTQAGAGNIILLNDEASDATPFVVDATGQVGIGILAPSVDLHVAGQCVTADTRLRRRRKKKKGEKADPEKDEWEDDEYIYDEVMIKDIQPGDEIASMDPITGKLVYSQVKGLMNMGIKEIYQLTTQSGRQIRTTENHPYFVRTKYEEDADVKQNQKLYKFEVDQSIRIENFNKDSIIAVANNENSQTITLPRKVKRELRDCLRQCNQSRKFNAAVFASAIVAALENMNARVHELVIDTEYIGYENVITDIILSKFAGIEISFTQIGRQSPAHHSAYEVHRKRSAADAIATVDTIIGQTKNALRTASLTRRSASLASPQASLITNSIDDNKNLVKGVGRQTKNALRWSFLSHSQGGESPDTPQALPINSINDNKKFVKDGQWIKVKGLKKGQMIAVTHGDKVVWEKITKIKKQAPEKVYDIEVEGTHNFVANGIVAHNTYINTDSAAALKVEQSGVHNNVLVVDTNTGRVGIGVAVPEQLLHISATDSNNAKLKIGAVDNSYNIWRTTSNGFLTFQGDQSGYTGYDFLSDDGSHLVTVIDSGSVGIGTTAPDKTLEINAAAGGSLRLTHNDSDGSAANYSDFEVDSGGDLTITVSGGDITLVGDLNMSAGAIFQPVYGSDDGLVLDVDFSEGVGEYTRDKSPYGNDGTRKPATATTIEDCEDDWVPSANVTAAADATNYKVGAKSVKNIVTDAFTTGLISYEVISSTDFSDGEDYVNLWIKSDTTLSNLELLLDETANCTQAGGATTYLLKDIPTIKGNSQWQRVEIDLGTVSTEANAVICVGLKTTTDPGAVNVWIDDINAYNGPTFADGKYGTGMAFDGTDDRVDCGNDASLDMNDVFSISFWMKAPDQAGYPRILAKGYNYYIYKETGQDRLNLKIYDGTTAIQVNPLNVFDNIWHHIVLTFDRTGSVYGYKDGEEINTEVVPDGFGNITNNNNLFIGAANATTHFLNGSIDETRIYSRALSSDEVKTHYLRGTKDHGLVKADKFRISDTSGQLVFETDATAGGTALTATQRDTGAIASLTNNALSTGAAFTLTNLGTGNSFVVNDASGDTTPFVIDNDGKVGIGVAAPGAALHIYRDLGGASDLGNFSEYQLVINSGTDTGDTAGILLSSSVDAQGGSAIVHYDTDSGGKGDLAFYTKQSTAAEPPVEVMRLDDNGNIGIGQTDPSAKLDIVALDADDTIALEINQQDTGSSVAATIINAGTGNSLSIDQNGNVGAAVATDGALFIENTGNTGIGLNVYSNVGAAAAGLVYFTANNTAFDQTILTVNQKGTGELMDIQLSGSSVFKVGQANVEISHPLNVNVAGDVGISYDLNFMNTGLSQITSQGPMLISAGDSNHYENLTLTTGNTGDVIVDVVDSTLGFKVLGSADGGYIMKLSPTGNMDLSQNLAMTGGYLTISQLSISDLGTPTGTPSAADGLMAADDYYYVITALNSNGETTKSTETAVITTTTATSSVALSWFPSTARPVIKFTEPQFPALTLRLLTSPIRPLIPIPILSSTI